MLYKVPKEKPSSLDHRACEAGMLGYATMNQIKVLNKNGEVEPDEDFSPSFVLPSTINIADTANSQEKQLESYSDVILDPQQTSPNQSTSDNSEAPVFANQNESNSSAESTTKPLRKSNRTRQPPK
eukprot:IDg6170t1